MQSNLIKHVTVIDIGKTNAKLAMVDLETRTEIAVWKTPNIVLQDGLYPHYDIEHLWQFILQSLRDLQQKIPIDAITVTTHGATAALLNSQGNLALPILDYEFTGPDELTEDYTALRPPFAETGSPRLPVGLNLGAQLFWQQKKFPQEFSQVAHVVMYPQYWAYRLSGVLATEVTSLGCHTDLWSPRTAAYSSLVTNSGWRKLMPPLRKAADHLGNLLFEIAAHTGLAQNTPIICGLHDSNASLVPHLLSRTTPCTVVSTGTWVISMAIDGNIYNLDPQRDTLINVNAFGNAVPSARFMGGREFELISNFQSIEISPDDINAVMQAEMMLLPAVVNGSGPFPHRKMQWIGNLTANAAQHQIAGSYYLALMTATCQDLIGARGDVIVEGPFSKNIQFLNMLAAATARPVYCGSKGLTGTTIGAAMLVAPSTSFELQRHHFSDDRFAAYAAKWKTAVSAPTS